jgi:hypothetical protein
VTDGSIRINQNAVKLGLVTIIGLLAAVFISVFIVASGDNPLGALASVAGGVIVVAGVVAPRTVLYWMIPITFGLDLVKRCLIIFTMVSLDDVARVLSVAPFAAVGIFIGCVIRRIFVRRRSEPVERVLFAAGTVLATAGSLVAFKESSLIAAMKVVANNSVYYFLPWALCQCLETRADIERFLKTAVLVAIPVALYGSFQAIFGVQDFELAYIRSGYAPDMAASVDDLKPHPFSTMSSPLAYGTTMAFMLTLSFYFAFRAGRFSRKWLWPFLVFVFALAVSMARAPMLMSMAMLGFAVLFSTRRGIWAAYALSGALVAMVITNAQLLLDGLDYWQKFLPGDTAWQEQTFRLGTISNRLMGYRNVLSNPSSWPLVANPLKYEASLAAEDELHSHDLYSQAILKYGIVPVAIALCAAVFFGIRVHRAVLHLPNGAIRNLGACFVGIIAGYFFGQLSGGGIGVFPLNFWLGIFAGFLVVLCFRRPRPDDELQRPEKSPAAATYNLHSPMGAPARP